MFEFVKKAFFAELTILSGFMSVNSLSCISMTNQECRVRQQIVYVNSNEPVFFPFSIKISKCGGSCNNINDPYAEMCVPDVVKKRFKCKCRLDASVCNNKQRWNDDKCRCQCKELIDKGVCDKGFTWNPSNCECECDKSCDVGEYLEYENCKCRKSLVDKLVEECTENIDEVKIASENEHKNKCSSCILYIVLFSILFTINVGIGTYFVYFHWYLKKDVTRVKFRTRTQTKI